MVKYKNFIFISSIFLLLAHSFAQDIPFNDIEQDSFEENQKEETVQEAPKVSPSETEPTESEEEDKVIFSPSSSVVISIIGICAVLLEGLLYLREKRLSRMLSYAVFKEECVPSSVDKMKTLGETGINPEHKENQGEVNCQSQESMEEDPNNENRKRRKRKTDRLKMENKLKQSESIEEQDENKGEY